MGWERCALMWVLAGCWTGPSPSPPPSPPPPPPPSEAPSTPPSGGGFAQPPPGAASPPAPGPASFPTKGPECDRGCPETAPLYPTEQCRDGIHIGGRGPCVRFASGCNWSALACPAAVPRVTCKPSDCDLPIPSAWRCPDGTSIGRFTCVATDQGTCGATYRPCPFHAKPAPTPSPRPTPPPRQPCPNPLPSDRELATWPIREMCSPGSGPDPGDVREIKRLGDGTRIVQANGHCVRARYRQCHTKCLPPAARIATPSGGVPIHELQVGSAIWTRTLDGRRVAARVEAMTNVAITGTHHVARIVLADGRTLTVSPEHPLADARVAQELRVGDAYDGSSIAKLALEPYTGASTYDLVPSGPTGVYWADGVPLRSTITRP